MSKVYYNHTSKLEATKSHKAPACTIALQRTGDLFYYGIAICSRKDNFSKSVGREIANSRLQSSFGTMPVPPKLMDMPESQACRLQLFHITESVVRNNNRWRRKLNKFNNFFLGNKREKNSVLEIA